MRPLNDHELATVSGGQETLHDFIRRFKEWMQSNQAVPPDNTEFNGVGFALSYNSLGNFIFAPDTGGYGGWFDMNNDGSDAGEQQWPSDAPYDFDGANPGQLPGEFTMTPQIENMISHFKPYGGS